MMRRTLQIAEVGIPQLDAEAVNAAAGNLAGFGKRIDVQRIQLMIMIQKIVCEHCIDAGKRMIVDDGT